MKFRISSTTALAILCLFAYPNDCDAKHRESGVEGFKCILEHVWHSILCDLYFYCILLISAFIFIINISGLIVFIEL